MLDFVHAGDRIYVVTGAGLICLSDDPGKGPAPAEFMLGPGAKEQARRAKFERR